MSERRHITRRPDGLWQDIGEHRSRPVSIHRTQSEAEAASKERLRRIPGGGEVIVHRPKGKIRDSDTIDRQDPVPPRDHKH
ncbi:MAG: DUF2188 domain-containing protein [Solirubrobacterales bacterium]